MTDDALREIRALGVLRRSGLPAWRENIVRLGFEIQEELMLEIHKRTRMSNGE